MARFFILFLGKEVINWRKKESLKRCLHIVYYLCEHFKLSPSFFTNIVLVLLQVAFAAVQTLAVQYTFSKG